MISDAIKNVYHDNNYCTAFTRFDPNSKECSSCSNKISCYNQHLKKLLRLLKQAKEICVIADPRSGSECPAHHNCAICEYLKRY